MKGFVKVQATEGQIDRMENLYTTALDYVKNYDTSKYDQVVKTWWGLGSKVETDYFDLLNDIRNNSPEGVRDFEWFDQPPQPILTSDMSALGEILQLLKLNNMCELDIEGARIFNKYKGDE